MNQLDRLETLAQRLIEGTFNRFFQTQLHPADVVHHLAVAIEQGRQSSANVVPNIYQIVLNPADYNKLTAGSSHQTEVSLSPPRSR